MITEAEYQEIIKLPFEKRPKCLYHATSDRGHGHVCGGFKGHKAPHECADCGRDFDSWHSWNPPRERVSRYSLI